jgi:hypothetical protein
MTLLRVMCQLQEDPDIRLGMIAWLKCCDITINAC